MMLSFLYSLLLRKSISETGSCRSLSQNFQHNLGYVFRDVAKPGTLVGSHLPEGNQHHSSLLFSKFCIFFFASKGIKFKCMYSNKIYMIISLNINNFLLDKPKLFAVPGIFLEVDQRCHYQEILKSLGILKSQGKWQKSQGRILQSPLFAF